MKRRFDGPEVLSLKGRLHCLFDLWVPMRLESGPSWRWAVRAAVARHLAAAAVRLPRHLRGVVGTRAGPGRIAG